MAFLQTSLFLGFFFTMKSLSSSPWAHIGKEKCQPQVDMW